MRRADGTFAHGHVPWIKGRKGFFGRGAEVGWFPKGQKPKNWHPVGTVTIRLDKDTKTPRRWIKIADGPVKQFNWKPYAAWLWEQANGPIPKGYLVHHVDGNSLHDHISNFSLITRAQHIAEHRRALQEARRRIGQHVGKGYIRA